MPKLKSRKSLSKRFKITAKGKLVCRKGGKSHLQSSKSGKRRRQLRQPITIANAMAGRIIRSVGN